MNPPAPGGSAVSVLALGIEESILRELERSSCGSRYAIRPVHSLGEIESAAKDPQLKVLLLDLDRYGWNCLGFLEANPKGHPCLLLIAVSGAETLEKHRAARYFKVREFLVRPFSAIQVEMALDRCLDYYQMKMENTRVRQAADHYRMELAHHLLRHPLGFDPVSEAEQVPPPLEEAIASARREKRWKELLRGQEDLDQLLERLIHLVTEEWKAERASLMLFDRTGGHLVIRGAAGIDDEVIEKTRVQVGQGPAGYVAKTRRPLLVQDPLDYLISNWPQRHEHPSFVSIPLLCAGQLVGVLNATGKTGGEEFNEEEMQSLETLGSIAADAIDRLILYEGLREGYLATIKALALAIERKDPYTCGHSERVSEYSLSIARELEMSDKEMEILESAAILHDIGKMGIPGSVVHKPGPLMEEENEVLRQHPCIGSELLSCLHHFDKERDVVRHHHEWYNGAGYPDALRGEQLTLYSRIVAIADAYDAMTTHRAYRPALSPKAAYHEVVAQSGSQFDPEIVRIFSVLWLTHSGNLLASATSEPSHALSS